MILCVFFILEELTGLNVLLSIMKYSFILKNKFKLLNSSTEQLYVKDIFYSLQRKTNVNYATVQHYIF